MCASATLCCLSYEVNKIKAGSATLVYYGATATPVFCCGAAQEGVQAKLLLQGSC